MAAIVTEEDRLVEAMSRGDQEALGRIIERYTAYVGTIVWNIVEGKLDWADGEEIVSDVFCALWRSAGQIRAGKLKSYLAVIARRKALNALRGDGPALPLEEDALALFEPGPEEEAIRQEEYEALRRTVDSLPEPDRTIFIRYYYYGRTTAQIAGALALNVNTVKVKLMRGRKRLRRELTEGGYFVG